MLVALRVWRFVMGLLNVCGSLFVGSFLFLSASLSAYCRRAFTEDNSSSSSQVSGVLVKADGIRRMSHKRACFAVSGSRRPALPQVLLCTFKGLALYLPHADSFLECCSCGERTRYLCMKCMSVVELCICLSCPYIFHLLLRNFNILFC